MTINCDKTIYDHGDIVSIETCTKDEAYARCKAWHELTGDDYD